jgi:hypothetical protein
VSVERVERKGGVVWRVRWRDEQGRERSRVIGRKRDAESFEAEVVRRKRTGDLDLLVGGRETLADFAEEWWKLYAVPNLARRTLRSYAGLWDRHVLPRLGSMRLSAVTPEVVERFRVELEAEGVGQPTIYRSRSSRACCVGRLSGGASPTTRSRRCRSRKSAASGRSGRCRRSPSSGCAPRWSGSGRTAPATLP